MEIKASQRVPSEFRHLSDFPILVSFSESLERWLENLKESIKLLWDQMMEEGFIGVSQSIVE
jgi:hypothetical protein